MASDDNLYNYTPSKAAAAIFAVLFGISTLLHIYQSIFQNGRRAWFMTAFLVGALFEVVGYSARIASANDVQARTPFIIQTLLILLAPALMAATIYMILGRIIQLTSGERFALIRRTWLTKIFVLGDVLSFIAQGIGGGMITNNNGTLQEQADRAKLGKNVILVGLWIQIIFFGIFLLVALLFQFRGRQHFQTLPAGLGWKKHMYTLYGVGFLVLVRSLFRVAEYIQGVDGYLYSHEAFLYIFDALLIFIAMVAMNVVHPADIARLLKGKDSLGRGAEMDEFQRV
jgi:hypothetical protein